MDRRIETRVIDTLGGTINLGVLIQTDVCEVWWINASPETLNTQGLLQIYDGFDATGKLEFQCEFGYCHQHNFTPPIPCDYGIYVVVNAQVASYTIAFRPKRWPKEVT